LTLGAAMPCWARRLSRRAFEVFRLWTAMGGGRVYRNPGRRAHADGSFASANDARVLVGLGGATAPPRVRVTWPDGTVEEWRDVPIDRYTTLVAGSSR